MDKLTKFNVGDQIVIDKDNADSWAPVIGQPLADAIKTAKVPQNTRNLVVTCIDLATKTITYSLVKED